MKVLVTGGAGFIGSMVVRTLTQDYGVEVRVMDDLSTGCAANLDGVMVEFVQGSILDEDLLRRSMTGIDSVIHLAARPSVSRSLQDPEASHRINVTGTLGVLEAARKVGAYVCAASSSSVYGANPGMPKREDMVCRPVSPYAVTKLAAESYTIAYARCFTMTTLAFRFFNVYGPRQTAGHPYAAVVPAFVSAALSGAPLQVHGDGRQTRDFTYVGTVADILSQAATRQIGSDTPVNLAFGTRTNLLDLIDRIEALVGVTTVRQFVDSRPGDLLDSQGDNAALRKLFPQVQSVPLDAGLSAMIKWIRDSAATASVSSASSSYVDASA